MRNWCTSISHRRVAGARGAEQGAAVAQHGAERRPLAIAGTIGSNQRSTPPFSGL